MNLRIYFLGLAGAAVAAAGVFAAAAVIQPRQENEDTMDLYLCSNPNFNHDCAGCACERLANLTTVGGYGGPPCCMLPLPVLLPFLSSYSSHSHAASLFLSPSKSVSLLLPIHKT